MKNWIKQRDWRRVLLLMVPAVAACGGLYLAARAGDGIVPAFKSCQSAAQLTVDSTEYEFPQAEPGTTVEHEFLIRNSGSKRLVLNLDECGCGKPVAEPMILLPGEKMTIPVSMKVRPYPKRQYHVASFTTSDPQYPRVDLRLVAELDWSTESDIQSPSDRADTSAARDSIAQSVQ